MKIGLGIIAAIVVLIGVISVSGGSEEASSRPSVVAESSDSIKTEIEAGEAAFLDVRTPAEFAESHAIEAENFSLQMLQAGMLPDIELDEKIYLYCRSGNRSAEAAGILEGAGYTNVIDLGGLSDVQALGLPFTN